MTAREIVKALSGSWSGSYGLCFCPCHNDGNTPALKVSDDDRKDDHIDLHCFAGCDWRDVKAELRRRELLPEPNGIYRRQGAAAHKGRRRLQKANAQIRKGDRSQARIEIALRIWRESESATGTVVVKYLHGRGIELEIPPSIRFHRLLKNSSSDLFFPAMIAAVQTLDRRITAIHRTFLLPDGRGKAQVSEPKMALGAIGAGAVRLAAATEELVLAEGIETALSVLQATGKPVWACLGTSGLKAVILPPEVKIVTIAADGDEAGEKAAQEAARRFYLEGREVKIARPPAGMDFNDLLMKPENVIPFPRRQEVANG